MLVVEILIIICFIIFGICNACRKDSDFVGKVLIATGPFLTGAIITALLKDPVAQIVSYIITIIVMFGWPFCLIKLEDHYEKSGKKDEDRRAKEEEIKSKLAEYFKANGSDDPEAVAELALECGDNNPIYGGVTRFYPYKKQDGWSAEEVGYWLRDKCFLEYLKSGDTAAYLREKLGCDINALIPPEMKPIDSDDIFNMRCALMACYYTKKGLPMHFFHKEEFFKYYPYCRKDFISKFKLPYPIKNDDESTWAVELAAEMSETPIQKTSDGHYRKNWKKRTFDI